MNEKYDKEFENNTKKNKIIVNNLIEKYIPDNVGTKI